MKFSFTFLIMLSIPYSVIGQKTHIQVGLLSAANESSEITIPGTRHYGYRAGLDTKIFGIGVYLLGGAHYYKYSSFGLNDREFFQQNNSLQIIKGRGGVGITPFALTPLLKIRLKALAAYSHIFSGMKNLTPVSAKNNYIGIDLGAGLTIGFFTVDLEYEKGYRGLLENSDDSHFNILSLTAGLQF